MPGLDEKTRAAILAIPSMGTHNVGDYLYDLCRQSTGRGVVIEVGTWLGASAAWMAAGLRESSHPRLMICFDRFVATESEVAKARTAGVMLDAGCDTREIVGANLDPIYSHVALHRCDIRLCEWDDDNPIEIYADDAAKSNQAFRHVLRTFGPSFIPGVTTVLLHDFNFDRKGHSSVQRGIMAGLADHFETVYDAWPASSLVAFRYVKKYDFATKLEAA